MDYSVFKIIDFLTGKRIITPQEANTLLGLCKTKEDIITSLESLTEEIQDKEQVDSLQRAIEHLGGK